jgi:glucans biosynthesis protein C
MKRWGVDTPDMTLRPSIPVLLLYGLCFLVGWMLHRQAALLEVLRKRWRAYALCAALLSLFVLAMSGWEAGSRGLNQAGNLRGIYQIFYGAMQWCWIFAAIGLFLRFFDQESHVWRYLSDASYWIYVIHLPVVTTLQVALVRLDLSCWTKFFLCSTGAILISVVSYQLVVRSTIVGQILNGRRHPFHWLPGTV